VLIDPSGLLAELYCERIPSTRGGSIFGDLIITLSQAQHCFIRIVGCGTQVIPQARTQNEADPASIHTIRFDQRDGLKSIPLRTRSVVNSKIVYDRPSKRKVGGYPFTIREDRIAILL
jgi:hypothetical protein